MYVARCDASIGESYIARTQCKILPRNCSIPSPLLQKDLLQIITEAAEEGLIGEISVLSFLPFLRIASVELDDDDYYYYYYYYYYYSTLSRILA